MQLTFDQLPNAVSGLYTKLENIERLLALHSVSQEQTDRWFNLSELCTYLPESPAKATVYGWISKKEVPHHKKGKKLYFLQSEIDAWLKSSRKKTSAELQTEADNYLHTARKKC